MNIYIMEVIKTIKYKGYKIDISADSDTESPREDSNLGYFITVDSNYKSPDDHNGMIYNIVKSTGDEANDQADHISLIMKAIREQTDEKPIAVYPITKYEHSGVSYSLGTIYGFDNSNNGFYIVTDKTAKELGTARKDFLKVIKQELEIYNQYANGEVYGYQIVSPEGEDLDSCWGFYGYDHTTSGLLESAQDEIDYAIEKYSKQQAAKGFEKFTNKKINGINFHLQNN